MEERKEEGNLQSTLEYSNTSWQEAPLHQNRSLGCREWTITKASAKNQYNESEVYNATFKVHVSPALRTHSN